MAERTAQAETQSQARARVVAVQNDLITLEAAEEGQLMKNEVIYVCPRGTDEQLKGEVLRVRGRTADAQIFEETRGVSVGDPVEQTGELLSAQLGPGLLANVYDGLQNPLHTIAGDHGFFLPKGVKVSALDPQARWAFSPKVKEGDRLDASGVLGSVHEGRFEHKIMVPFDEPGPVEVTWIQAGTFTVDTAVARIRDASGNEREVTMTQSWPVRKALPQNLLRRRLAERLYPSEPLITTQRLIDTFFPIARGGTACIPGPFGAGKTVLQHLLSRYSAADIVIVVGCGERAGEIVEILTEFPELSDPRTGGSLMDRTVIIANTSSMPVAAREASIYLGITLGEYYRQMGYSVLLLADSTSRWAQALRETSGRLEEIPGEEAFPAYLDSAIRGLYERAGVLQTQDGSVGSLTIIGNVSPAGGNFEEPVTQSTLATVKTFLGLSAARAYKRYYPAVDPLISWSRYLEQLAAWFDQNVAQGWTGRVAELSRLLKRGDEIEQMMQVTGEEGITLTDFVTQQKALLVDMVYLQQDAFDSVDATTSLERQKASFALVYDLASRDYDFADKEAARTFFTRLTGLYKNLNYAREDSPQYADYRRQIEELAQGVTRRPAAVSA
ncbi:MAG: V-type ATP synthase subunit A [Acidobacteriota bacterium]|nr:V-type ATP synthase subunit A [Acidobacteriota bacterium]